MTKNDYIPSFLAVSVGDNPQPLIEKINSMFHKGDHFIAVRYWPKNDKHNYIQRSPSFLLPDIAMQVENFLLSIANDRAYARPNELEHAVLFEFSYYDGIVAYIFYANSNRRYARDAEWYSQTWLNTCQIEGAEVVASMPLDNIRSLSEHLLITRRKMNQFYIIDRLCSEPISGLNPLNLAAA